MSRFVADFDGGVIDLVSDSEDDLVYPIGAEAELNEFLDFDNDDEAVADFIDLTAIPDVDVPPHPAPPVPAENEIEETVGEAQCLQLVLNVFPDIAVDYVLNLINEQDTCTTMTCERLIANLLDGGTYPKESDEDCKRKRKRRKISDDVEEFEDDKERIKEPNYNHDALDLLKDEFPEVPVRHITNVLNEKKYLVDAYSTLESQIHNYNKVSVSFRKVGKARLKRGHEAIMVAAGKTLLLRELRTARNWGELAAIKRHQEEKAKDAEEANLLRAQVNGEMSECLCCFDEFPINRMTCCAGETIHFFCRTCAKTYVEEEIGKMRCRPVCFADPACGGTFTRTQLLDFLGSQSFERLEHLQQQDDLRAAGLDFLEECPFCDFKAECLPVEVDREFRCLSPKCQKISCRLCQKETHIPKTCEEVKKDEKLTVRHTVEEAKSEALIRHCNRCKNAFIKEYGCNKMTCTKCGNTQCYVCSKNVTSYEHFGDGSNGRGKCPLHDNHEDRHEQEVQKAEAEVLAKIRAERPDISEEELVIKVSDRVKQAEKARKQQAQARHDGFGFHMDGDRLVAAPAAPNRHPGIALRGNPFRGFGEVFGVVHPNPYAVAPAPDPAVLAPHPGPYGRPAAHHHLHPAYYNMHMQQPHHQFGVAAQQAPVLQQEAQQEYYQDLQQQAHLDYQRAQQRLHQVEQDRHHLRQVPPRQGWAAEHMRNFPEVGRGRR